MAYPPERIEASQVERATLDSLRREADLLKDCAVRHVFQAVTMSVTALAAIIAYQASERGDTSIGLASVPIILLLVIVTRTAVHKFESAHRNLSYQLHLERTAYQVAPGGRSGWNSSMRSVGWEEAMRAWRVVQPTVFSHIHRSRWFLYSKRYKHRRQDYLWYEPERLARLGATYSPGTYLRDMTRMIHLLMVLLLIPPLVFVLKESVANSTEILVTVVLVVGGLVVLASAVLTRAKVRLLESGILSLHSMAIIWQATIVAHFRALFPAGHGDKPRFRQYTERLGAEADRLCRRILEIHKWIDDEESLVDVIRQTPKNRIRFDVRFNGDISTQARATLVERSTDCMGFSIAVHIPLTGAPGVGSQIEILRDGKWQMVGAVSNVMPFFLFFRWGPLRVDSPKKRYRWLAMPIILLKHLSQRKALRDRQRAKSSDPRVQSASVKRVGSRITHRIGIRVTDATCLLRVAPDDVLGEQVVHRIMSN